MNNTKPTKRQREQRYEDAVRHEAMQALVYKKAKAERRAAEKALKIGDTVYTGAQS
jgi:hypothetical protein